jgi:taurine dioxygenase
MRMMVEEITPRIGAIVTGLDVRSLAKSDREHMRELLERHLVLVFPDQKINLGDLENFGEVMGEIEVSPTLKKMDGEWEVIQMLEASGDTARGRFADHWHSDMPYVECPSYATIIWPEILPRLGGDTLWSNMYAAYEALPDAIRRLVDDLEGVNIRAAPGQSVYEAIHPIVRVNPVDGRCGLYVTSMFTKRIVGLSDGEGQKLLDLLFTHLSSPDFQMRLRWKSQYLVIWDNRFTQHYAVNDYNERRLMLRMTLSGDRPLGPTQFD